MNGANRRCAKEAISQVGERKEETPGSEKMVSHSPRMGEKDFHAK